jgi:hypothetical protein
MKQITPPKIFISYSWTSPEHVNAVIALAERLVSDGVDVLLDKWDLKEGQDKYAYMEKMVVDATVSKVLILSDAQYAKKADERKGGVGTESQIISKEIYDKVNQQKFIPVVFEYDEHNKPCLPVFLATRIYLDFSNPEKYHEDYERLLRLLFNKPLHKKPEIGKPPQHILEDTKHFLGTASKANAFKYAVLNDKSHFRGLAADYLNAFQDGLDQFRITGPNSETPLDELVVGSIGDFLPHRNEFVDFLKTQILYKNDTEVYELIAEFFESSLRYKGPPPDTLSWSETWYDNYDFILHELFLYLVALLLRHKRFPETNIFLDRQYLLPQNLRHGGEDMISFGVFRAYCESLNDRNKRLKLNRLSIFADLIKERATVNDLSFDRIMQAEFVLFIRSILSMAAHDVWYPATLIYAGYSKPFEIFARAQSHSEFERLKGLLKVNSKEELVAKYLAAAEKYGINRWSGFTFRSSVSFEHLMNLEKLDTVQ